MPTTADGIVRYSSRSGIFSVLGIGGAVDADAIVRPTDDGAWRRRPVIEAEGASAWHDLRKALARGGQ